MLQLKNIFTWLLTLLFSTALFAQTVLTDPEIAHVVVTANNVDISAGKLAKTKSKNKEVKEFAERMITDHTGVNKEAMALVKKLGVKPMDNESSKSLTTEGKTNIKKLRKLILKGPYKFEQIRIITRERQEKISEKYKWPSGWVANLELK